MGYILFNSIKRNFACKFSCSCLRLSIECSMWITECDCRYETAPFADEVNADAWPRLLYC